MIGKILLVLLIFCAYFSIISFAQEIEKSDLGEIPITLRDIEENGDCRIDFKNTGWNKR